MKEKKSIKKVISIAAMSLIFSIITAGNIVAGYFGEMITTYFYGSGIDFEENETFSQAIAESLDLNVKIAEEGIVMVRNENNALPMSDSELEKVNVFGWSSSPGGWLCGSDGSAASNSGSSRAKVKGIIQVLNEENNIETNEELTSMYTSFCSARVRTSSTASDNDLLRALKLNENYYMLHEPSRSYYDKIGNNGKTILQNAKDFSSTAIVVMTRLGGEGTDLPFKQIKNDTGKKNYANASDCVIDNTRTYLDISTEEEDMLRMVRDNFEKVVVIVNSCNEMNLSFLEDYDIDACLTMNGLGENGTYALPSLLRGYKYVYNETTKTNEKVLISPSGKTGSIHTYDFTTNPSFVNAGGKTASSGYVVYQEDIYVGYKWYETADSMGYWDDVDNKYGKGYDGVVQYPFGYGLTYGDFSWTYLGLEAKDKTGRIIDLSKENFDGSTEFTMKVRVTNNSDYPARDVVELYFNPPYYQNGIEKSSVNLLAFAKTEVLEKDKSQVLELKFTGYDMASYDCYDKNANRNVGYELDRGNYQLSLRTDSHTIKDLLNENNVTISNPTINLNLSKTIRITKDPVTGNRVTNRFTSYDVITKQNDGTFATENIKAYGGSAIDGSDATQEDVKYLTRSNFKTTFPTKKAVSRTGTLLDAAKTYQWDGYNVNEIPEINQSSTKTNHLLYKLSNGSKASFKQLQTGVDLVPNKELILELGGDYDNPKWDELLSQMTPQEINTLLNRGGYCTFAVESIGKKHMLENDGPSGLNRHNMEIDNTTSQTINRSSWTMFSMPSVLGTSWDYRLAYAFGKSVGTEGISVGVSGWYAPGANMQRSPFGGRNSEYYSEDALLSGVMAAETSRGAMSMGMNVYIKHFVANETETKRTGLITWLTEQTLREIYCRPFEIAVKRGKANGMMTSFNRIGTTWAGGNQALMTEVLRNEWGFRGACVTDYYSSSLMNVDQGLKAGNDLWLTGSQKNAKNIDTSNKVIMYFARQACKNILFASCNAYYMHENRDKSLDTITIDLNTVVAREIPAPLWIYWGLLPLDLITLCGLSIWSYFLFRKKKEI